MKSADVKGIYDSNYFLVAVDGFREFSSFDGSFEMLFPRYQRNIELLKLEPSHDFLELGCGRGEICIYHSLRGGLATGVDFSGDAIFLAKEKAKSLHAKATFIEASFDEFDVETSEFDRILASEFIEHISANEGEIFFHKVYRLLKPGGKLLVFTFPNTLQRRYGYPLQRLMGAIKGKPLPSQQDDTVGEHYCLYHLNEQNYFTLRNAATDAGFRKISIGYDMGASKTALKRFVMNCIGKTPLRHIFFNNLYLLAEK